MTSGQQRPRGTGETKHKEPRLQTQRQIKKRNNLPENDVREGLGDTLFRVSFINLRMCKFIKVTTGTSAETYTVGYDCRRRDPSSLRKRKENSTKKARMFNVPQWGHRALNPVYPSKDRDRVREKSEGKRSDSSPTGVWVDGGSSLLLLLIDRYLFHVELNLTRGKTSIPFFPSLSTALYGFQCVVPRGEKNSDTTKGGLSGMI